jgi:hypothetical protein
MHDEIPCQRRHGRRWSAWFDGLDVSGDERGQAAIAGPVVDQAAGTACWPGSRPRSDLLAAGCTDPA